MLVVLRDQGLPQAWNPVSSSDVPTKPPRVLDLSILEFLSTRKGRGQAAKLPDSVVHRLSRFWEVETFLSCMNAEVTMCEQPVNRI